MKKGQVSAFIIIGVIILLIFSISIYTKNKRQTFVPTVVVPLNVVPVQQYLEQCISESAKEGLELLGLQGGYIYLPPMIEMVRASYIGLGNVRKIPLWYFEGETRIPSLSYMEKQLERYVNESIDSCKEGLGSYDSYFDFKFYDKTVEVKFGEDDTFVNVDFPIEIKDRQGRQVTRIRDFSSVLPVRMKQIYDLAEKVFRYEIENLFLDNLSMELMAGDPTFPFSGIEPKCGDEKWSVTELKEHLSKVIYYNLQRVRIKGTDYRPFLEDIPVYESIKDKAALLRDKLKEADYDEGDPFEGIVRSLGINNVPEDIYEYTKLYFDVGADNNDMKVGFISYDDMDFSVEPSEGDVMSTRMLKGPFNYLRFLCLNMYHFSYSYNFPIEVRIIDFESFPSEGGFSFSFGVPIMIRENAPASKDYYTPKIDVSNPTYEFCGNRGGEVTIEARGIYEGYTNLPVPGVNFTYLCMSHYCYLGSSVSGDSTFRFKGAIPEGCTNAYIRAEKEGYLPVEVQLSGDKLEIPIEKLHRVNVSFLKYPYLSDVDMLRDEPVNLADENVVVSVHLNNSDFDQYFSSESSSTLDFVLMGGIYDIEALLVKDGEVLGGFIVEDYPISYDTLSNSQELIIPLVDFRPTPISDNEKGEMMMYMYNGDYKAHVGLEFK